MKFQATLLCVQENAHETAGLIAEYSRSAMNLAVADFESIDSLLGRAVLSAPQYFTELREPRWLRQKCQALFKCPGDEINIPQMRINITHELLDPFARRPFFITEGQGYGWL